jgi:YidC/Oxa1 family membrane protein insertase
MDKNTLTGMLLMALVLFGFMYYNQNEQTKLQQQMQEQAEAQKSADEAAAAKELIVDSITSSELAGVPAILRKAGTPDSDNPQTVHYTTSTVDLTYDGESITGTVKAADTLLSYTAVVNSQFGDNLSVAARKEAISNLRQALSEGERYRGFARHLNGEDALVTLKNNLLQLDIATHGGNIAQATLLDYDTYLPKPENKNEIDTAAVNVCRLNESAYSFILTSASQRFDTSNFYFTPEVLNDSTVVMKLDLGDGATWALRYTLPNDSYVVKMELVQEHMDKVIPSSVATVDLVWNQQMGRNEDGRTFEERNSGLYYKYIGDNADNLGSNGDHTKSLNQQLKWIAFKNQFFSTVMIPTTHFVGAEVESTDLKGDPNYVKKLNATATLDYSSTSANPVSINIFYGPNSYPLLKHLDKQLTQKGDEGLDLTRMIPLGWSFFRWINTGVIIPIFTFLSKYIANYGVIILLLTLFIKIVLFPLTYKSYVSQAKMRALAPEIKEINEKYPGQDNAMTRNQKTMELYSRVGASPFSGCLPMLLQMPVLIAMFWFFPSCIELRGESFLWAKNLAAPDYIFTLPFSIPWYGDRVSLFCLLMTITNIGYSYINMQNQPSASSTPGMKWMMYLMPVMFLFIFNDYAAGLSYYYFLSLLITIIQTYAVRLSINEEKLRAKLMANASKPKKKTGFMARLEEAQRQQQAMMREQQKKNNNSKGRH